MPFTRVPTYFDRFSLDFINQTLHLRACYNVIITVTLQVTVCACTLHNIFLYVYIITIMYGGSYDWCFFFFVNFIPVYRVQEEKPVYSAIAYDVCRWVFDL